jgi:hypothetical protein
MDTSLSCDARTLDEPEDWADFADSITPSVVLPSPGNCLERACGGQENDVWRRNRVSWKAELNR